MNHYMVSFILLLTSTSVYAASDTSHAGSSEVPAGARPLDDSPSAEALLIQNLEIRGVDGGPLIEFEGTREGVPNWLPTPKGQVSTPARIVTCTRPVIHAYGTDRPKALVHFNQVESSLWSRYAAACRALGGIAKTTLPRMGRDERKLIRGEKGWEIHADERRFCCDRP